MASLYPRILFCLFFLGLPAVSLLQGEEIQTLRFDGGESTHWSGEVWRVVQDGTTIGDLIEWIDGSDAEIPEGSTVRVAGSDGTITVRNLSVSDIGDRPEIRTSGTGTLRITGEMSGGGDLNLSIGVANDFEPSATRRALVFAGAQPQILPENFDVYTGTSTHAAVVTIESGSELTFAGSYSIEESQDAYFYLQGDAHLIIAETALINNNQEDLVNARPFLIIGDGEGEATAEMEPGFNVDWADPEVRSTQHPWAFPESPNYPFTEEGYIKPVGGLSTLGINQVNLTTRSTSNLPSIHKYTGGTKRYTHHGLFNLRQGSEGFAQWTVDGEDQYYDSGVYFEHDWVLDTQSTLTSEAIWHDGVQIAFGSIAPDLTFTKTGPADLILRSTQVWEEGSTLAIEEGRVLFQTNPDAYKHDYYTEEDPETGELTLRQTWLIDDPGNHLNLTVHPSATAAFQPAPTSTDQYWLETKTFDIYSATVDGTLHLELNEGRADAAEPVLAVADHLTFGSSGATLTVTFAPGFSPQAETDYLLLTAGSLNLPAEGINGDLPSGWTTEVNGNDLWLVPATATGFDTWVADHLGGTAETAPSDDPWGQGITNLERYALGYPVTSLPAVAERPRAVRASGGAGETLFQFRRPTNVPDDVTYTVQVSENLTPESWSDIDPSQWTTTEDGGYEIISVELNGNGTTPDRLFARLLLSME